MGKNRGKSQQSRSTSRADVSPKTHSCNQYSKAFYRILIIFSLSQSFRNSFKHDLTLAWWCILFKLFRLFSLDHNIWRRLWGWRFSTSLEIYSCCHFQLSTRWTDRLCFLSWIASVQSLIDRNYHRSGIVQDVLTS